MKYFIKNDVYALKIETDCFCKEASDLDEYDIDFIYDIISDAVCAWESKCIGYFSESEADQEVYSNAVKYVLSKQDDLFIESIEIDEGKILRSVRIPIVDMVLDLLETAHGDSGFDAHTGAYVEKCLADFVSNAEWQFALMGRDGQLFTDFSQYNPTKSSEGEIFWEQGQLRPIMWFGPQGQAPIARWLIGPQTKDDELSFWMEYDPWVVIKSLGDFSECFLIWYTAECGNWAPDIDVIRKNCPVSFSSETPVDVLLTRISQYIFEKM